MVSSYRNIPSVEKLLSDDRIKYLVNTYSHEPMVGLLQRYLQEIRLAIAEGNSLPSLDALVEGVVSRATSVWRPYPIPIINATGVIIHTNLGRAVLSEEAIEAVVQAAKGYSNLELDLADGKRSSRQTHVEAMLSQIIGSEAAFVVNNNASAVLLALSAIAIGKEVLVSRGEAVEIGGGFRIPDVLRQSGATLVEVGTTNRTYLADYEAAITPNTTALLKVHASNFRITGFTHEASVRELVDLGTRYGIPVIHDQGSGCLLDTTQFGLTHEPTPQESVSCGTDLVLFSGDKLLGGPQAGIVAGRKNLIEHLAKHPLARAIRIDKMSLAALTVTLLHYLKGETLEVVPVWRMISATVEELKARASGWRRHIGKGVQVIRGFSTIGGGSLPGETLPTWLVALYTDSIPDGAQGLAKRLREMSPPVMARIDAEQVLLDPRTVLPQEEQPMLESVKAALNR